MSMTGEGETSSAGRGAIMTGQERGRTGGGTSGVTGKGEGIRGDGGGRDG